MYKFTGFKFTGVKGYIPVEFFIDMEWKDIKEGEFFTVDGVQYMKVGNKHSNAHRYGHDEEVIWNNEPGLARFALRYDTRDKEYWDKIYKHTTRPHGAAALNQKAAEAAERTVIMTIYRKTITGRRGTWNKYIARIKIDGKDTTVQVKFGGGSGAPEGEYPREIEVDKASCNIKERPFTRPDGTEDVALEMWINKWTDTGKYKDPLMNSVEF